MNKNIKFILKLGGILFLITAICVFALALCNNLTKDTIAKINLEKEENARRQVLGIAESFEEEKTGDDAAIYVGKKGGEEVGYCVSISPKGFGGDINLMVGVDLNLNVTGVEIINMSETPGLGSKASDKKFISQFNGKGENISVIKSGAAADNEIVAISGATVTSKAVTEGVNNAIKAVKEFVGVAK